MKAVAGDFKTGYVWVQKTLFGKPKALGFRGALFRYDKLSMPMIASFSISDREKATSWLSKLGWAGAIGLVLGPAGALGGMLASGNKDEAVAEVVAKDGRRALVTGPTRELREIERVIYTLQSQRSRSSRVAAKTTGGH